MKQKGKSFPDYIKILGRSQAKCVEGTEKSMAVAVKV